MRAPAKFLALLAGLGLPACQPAAAYHLEEGKAALARADYESALFHYRQAQEVAPGDAEIAQHVKDAQILALRDEARQLVFGDKDEEALEVLDRVLELRPQDKLARDWQDKARRKLADRKSRMGDTFFFLHDLENALQSYHDAFKYVPGFGPAEEGVKLVAADYERRRKKANDHYVEGVRALAERLFGQTYYHMFNSLANDPSREGAEEKKKVATQRLMQKRYSAALESERLKAWRSALTEYRSIRVRVPDYPGIGERIEAMEREVQAEELARKAERLMTRGDTTGAIELLEKAMETTGRDRLRMSELVAAARDKETEAAFLRGKDLEYDHKYPEALEAYRAIEQRSPGYSNVRTRISYYEETLKLVEQSYQNGLQAEAAGERDKAIGFYRDVQAALPNYKDAPERLEKLKSGK
jgi:tetratricopeptide (TPR) repeat protein